MYLSRRLILLWELGPEIVTNILNTKEIKTSLFFPRTKLKQKHTYFCSSWLKKASEPCFLGLINIQDHFPATEGSLEKKLNLLQKYTLRGSSIYLFQEYPSDEDLLSPGFVFLKYKKNNKMIPNSCWANPTHSSSLPPSPFTHIARGALKNTWQQVFFFSRTDSDVQNHIFKKNSYWKQHF